MSGVSNDVVKECRTIMLVKKMDISSFIIHAQQIEKKSQGEGKEV